MDKFAEEKSRDIDEPFFKLTELLDIHENAKAESLSQVGHWQNNDLKITNHEENKLQFQKQPKLGGVEITKPFEDKLIEDIKIKYKSFELGNDRKRSNFEVSWLKFSSIIIQHS